MLIAREVSNILSKIKIICLYRHPVDVASSKVSLRDWQWFHEPLALVENDITLGEIVCNQISIIREAKTLFEKFVAMWCINYFVVINQFGNSIIYIPYDFILQQPEQSFRLMVEDIVPPVPFEANKFWKAFTERSSTDRRQSTPKYLPSEFELNFAQRAIEDFKLADFVTRVKSNI
jgi:hypothetical protein